MAGTAKRLVLITTGLCMGDLVNLRAARKRAKRHQAEQQAASNRLAHGRSKAQRLIEQSRRDQADKALDRQRIETGNEQ